MYLSSEKVLSLLVLGSPGKFFSVQQTPLPLDSNSDVGTFQDNHLIRDVEYGYKGPGVYHITGSSDLFNLVPDQNGSGDGAPVVVWYVFYLRITISTRHWWNWRKSNDTNSQRWFISNVGNGYVTVANNDTGVLLSATSSKSFILELRLLLLALHYPPMNEIYLSLLDYRPSTNPHLFLITWESRNTMASR